MWHQPDRVVEEISSRERLLLVAGRTPITPPCGIRSATIWSSGVEAPEAVVRRPRRPSREHDRGVRVDGSSPARTGSQPFWKKASTFAPAPRAQRRLLELGSCTRWFSYVSAVTPEGVSADAEVRVHGDEHGGGRRLVAVADSRWRSGEWRASCELLSRPMLSSGRFSGMAIRSVAAAFERDAPREGAFLAPETIEEAAMVRAFLPRSVPSRLNLSISSIAKMGMMRLLSSNLKIAWGRGGGRSRRGRNFLHVCALRARRPFWPTLRGPLGAMPRLEGSAKQIGRRSLAVDTRARRLAGSAL
jgi:hypothetical protein